MIGTLALMYKNNFLTYCHQFHTSRHVDHHLCHAVIDNKMNIKNVIKLDSKTPITYGNFAISTSSVASSKI